MAKLKNSKVVDYMEKSVMTAMTIIRAKAKELSKHPTVNTWSI